MEQTFLTGIEIKKVRHLKNISISLDEKVRKHLILTGKNGSGKTSVLESLVKFFDYITRHNQLKKQDINKFYEDSKEKLNKLEQVNDSEEKFAEINELQKNLNLWQKDYDMWNSGAIANINSLSALQNKYNNGDFIFAYYKDERELKVEQYKNIEKLQFQDTYKINDNPGTKLTKYLVDLKATEAFAKDSEKSEKIDAWFIRFENILRKIFNDEGLKLNFNDETFQFTITASNREPFDFNTMSRGYAAILDIVNDLIMRMEAQKGLRTDFDMEGVVLVDEIETHLHLELQKKILIILTELFPNIQFIVTTHSPFILSSLENAVIYDLENRTLVKDGLSDVPYSGIVEGYFNTDELSEELRDKFMEYKRLANKTKLDADDYEKLADLELYLDEIPDYLALNLTAEYHELKIKLRNREI